MPKFNYVVQGSFKPANNPPTIYAEIQGQIQGPSPFQRSLDTLTIGVTPGATYSPPIDQSRKFASLFATPSEFNDLTTNLLKLRKFGTPFTLVVDYFLANQEIIVQSISSPPAATIEEVYDAIQSLIGRSETDTPEDQPSRDDEESVPSWEDTGEGADRRTRTG